MSLLSFTIGESGISAEEPNKNPESIKGLLKSTKEYQNRLSTFLSLLKNKYDKVVQSHNLDEVREFVIRINSTQVLLTQLLKELVISDKTIHSQLAQTVNNTNQEPIILLPKHSERLSEIEKEIDSLQKEFKFFFRGIEQLHI